MSEVFNKSNDQFMLDKLLEGYGSETTQSLGKIKCSKFLFCEKLPLKT